MTVPGLSEALDRLVPVAPFEPDWQDVLARAEAAVPVLRRRRTWFTLAVAAVVIGLLVSPAFGLGGKFLDLFTGSPAPEPVKRELAFGSNERNDQVDELMHQELKSSVLVGQARGLMEVSTEMGILQVWGAPTSDGGLCTYMWLPLRSDGWLSCDTLVPESPPLTGAADTRDVDGRTLRYVSGYAAPGIDSVELRLTDGSASPARLVDGFFIAVLFPGEQPASLIARDTAGKVVAEQRVRLGEPTFQPPVEPVGPSRTLAVLPTEVGKVTFEAAPGPDGKRCWIVTSETTQATACRAVPRGVEFDLGPHENPEQTRRAVLFSGLVGHKVRSLRLEFEDGSSIAIPLVERYFVYELPKEHWKAGHRPTRLVARGSGGEIIARRRVFQEGL